jgi:chaperonin GroES
MQIAAHLDHVFVKRLEPRATSKILWTPKPGKKEIHEGIVRHAGPGWINSRGERMATTVKPGDRVIFTGDGCKDVVLDGEELIAMKEGLIMLVLEAEAGDEAVEAAPQ